MRQPKILVIDDEPDISRILRMNLERHGYRVVTARDAETGLKTAREEKPDLFLIDVMLPKMDGMELCAVLRRETKAPIIFLTAMNAEVDRLLGFKLGADDYISKPFSIPEVEARVHAVLKRSMDHGGKERGGVVAAGSLEVDLERHAVRVNGKYKELAPKELEVLEVLARADGRVLTREELLKRVWGYDEEQSLEIDTRTVDQHVARLRRKLRPEGERLVTVKKQGYRLAVE
ncbi:MAG: response regulator transcription factor [Elusimicrobia bacterium]|nr:response regulator transcription factor [Elusimicrobiota bacterium]